MTQDIDIKLLTLLERNPRRIKADQMEKLCESLKSDPDYLHKRPVLVNRVGDKLIVYAGNQRVKAAKKLKWKTIPCIIEDNLDEKLIKERIIKDNKTYGEFDFDMLANEYDVEMLIQAGFSHEELHLDAVEQIETTDEEDNKQLEPVKDEDAKTKLGDIYELNGHRIVCGDSTLPEVVEKCLNSATPILMVTDPPYGVEYDPSWRSNACKGVRAIGKVQNDDKINWALAWFLFPGSIAYVWHAGKYSSEVEKSLIESEYEIIAQIIWAKQHFALSRGDYHVQHETCWYAVKKGNPHNWQGSRKESTLWEISNLNAFGKNSDEDDERTSHGTQKPIECMAKPIRNNSAIGEGVYDPFIGSGTTLIAAESLGRVCYGIELSPAYVDLVVTRWKNYMVKNEKPYLIKKNGEVINEI